MKQLVSIIIPVYNMENLIEKSISSILNQDYSNLEIILVDDGSTDESYRVCQQISNLDTRVRCVHSENQGSGPARNIGITESKGRYLYFPDADDFLEVNAISTLVDAMCNGKYDLIVFGYRCVSHDGDLSFEKKYDQFENSGEDIRHSYSSYFGMNSKHAIQGAPWNKFFDGNVIRDNGILYPALRRHQDEGFISRYVSHCKNVKFIPDVLYVYYQNTVGLEWNKYPVNYIDAVIGLDDVWTKTICSWNCNDNITHQMVNKEIFSKKIKSLELSFSPKLRLNIFTRPKWIRKVSKKSDFSKYNYNVAGSIYQKTVLFFAKVNLYFLLAVVLYIGNYKKRIRQGR